MSDWVDAFSRRPRKLRISVTDRCNLRCVYCMPENPSWLPKEELLSFEELARVAALCAANGVDRIRLTGGEPMLRRDLPKFVGMLKKITGLREIAMTTNGLLLPQSARPLREAGLDRVTVSLDSLDRKRVLDLARRDARDAVLIGIRAAQDAGFTGDSLKVNVVVMRGKNDAEIGAITAWAREQGLHLRFIEFMPLEGDRIWSRSLLVPAEEIVASIRKSFPLSAGNRAPGETAETYAFKDGKGGVGVIASVTKAFCADCDRVRLTADGGFRTCLFATASTDLRGPMRAGASDEALAALMAGAVSSKARGHLIDSPDFQRPDRDMHAIGG